LALFGRRPPQGVEGFVIPASKNLHKNGREQLQQILEANSRNGRGFLRKSCILAGVFDRRLTAKPT
jgi:hypothetical protein